MLGPEGVGALVAQQLLDGIVDEVNHLSTTNGPLADGTGALPAPDLVDPVVVAGLVVPQLVTPSPPDDVSNVPVDQWPFLAVSIRSTPRVRQLDMDPFAGAGAGRAAGVVYDVDYVGRIYTWVRGDGYEQTKAIRDRLMLAVRQLLLRVQVSGPLRLVAPSLTEDFAPIGIDTSLEASVGAGWTQATWRAQESLDDLAVRSATAVTVSVGRLP